MKKIFFITIILLLQSFPSFGNPNGKGIVCNLIEGVVFKNIDKEQTVDSDLGFGFRKDKVTMSFLNLNEENDKVIILQTPSEYFKTTKRKIKWGKYSSYVLDRKSLILNIKHSNGGSKFQCEVYEILDYLLEFENLRDKHQKDFDKKFNQIKNKI